MPLIKDCFTSSIRFTRPMTLLPDSVVKSGFVDTVNQSWVGCGSVERTLPTAAQVRRLNALLPRFLRFVPAKVRADTPAGTFTIMPQY